MPQERCGPVLCLLLERPGGAASCAASCISISKEEKPNVLDALFTAIGGQPATEDGRGRLAYSHNGSRFMVSKPIDGKPASSANGGTIGFSIGDRKLAEAWHKTGVANGGTSIEDPPGVRPNGTYLAYLRDPDGNKLVAVARPAA
jgi:catechol 2,3-dioxygenase-like lactoylglutathione lyase family enzyme